MIGQGDRMSGGVIGVGYQGRCGSVLNPPTHTVSP